MVRHSIALIGLVVGLISSSARATSVVPFTFDSLCETAEKIAHVTCISSESFEANDGIRTRIRFQVMEGVKGAAADEIELALPGGQVGDRRVSIAGMPSFKPGEETVIFLSGPDRAGSPWPVGLGQGCYPVTKDSASKPTVRLRRGATPIPVGAALKPVGMGVYEVELGAFLDKVRETVGVEADALEGEESAK